MLGLKNIGTGSGYYLQNGDLSVTNSILAHYRVPESTSSAVFYDDMCIQSAGFDNVRITGNTLIDCGVGFFVPSNFYATSTYYGGNGTRDLQVNNNTFEDCTVICMWYYLNANVHDAKFNGNVFSGTVSEYNVYSQDATSYSVEIDGNTLTAENPIYLRGAREWSISNNDITGIGSAANACVYVLNGHGDISGNSCTDADGGIAAGQGKAE